MLCNPKRFQCEHHLSENYVPIPLVIPKYASCVQEGHGPFPFPLSILCLVRLRKFLVFIDFRLSPWVLLLKATSQTSHPSAPKSQIFVVQDFVCKKKVSWFSSYGFGKFCLRFKWPMA